jgi:hypothetical protein
MFTTDCDLESSDKISADMHGSVIRNLTSVAGRNGEHQLATAKPALTSSKRILDSTLEVQYIPKNYLISTTFNN